MSPWWNKSTSKEANGEGVFGLIQRKLKSLSEFIQIASRRRSKIDSKTGSKSQASSSSTPVARSQNVADGTHTYPLPIPKNLPDTGHVDVGKRQLRNSGSSKCSSPLFLYPLPESSEAQNRHDQPGIEGHWELDSVFTYSDSDTDDPSDSRLLSPQTSSYDTGNKTSAISPLGHITFSNQKRREKLKQAKAHVSHRAMRTSPKRHPLSCHTVNSQNESVTPLHPWAGKSNMYSFANKPANALNGKQQAHRLPLPPPTISNTGPCSPSHSTRTTVTVSKSPGRADLLASQASCWKKGRLLGRGTFGHVYLGFNSERGEMCAMKEVTLFSDDAKSKESARQLEREIAILSRLRHPNIVQYYGSEIVGDKLYIYLEYVSGGSVYKLLQEYGQLGEHAIKRYTRQILLGLAYLHDNSTVHRDIKGANILVDPNGHVKLADFGMAKHISGPSCSLSFKGSPYWMAPEIINNNSNGCNLVVDIWSLGCTIVEMATTKPPWSQYEGVAALFKIANSKECVAIPDHLSDDGKDFVFQCLQRSPSQRPSAAQLLNHPFVNNIASPEILFPNPGPISNPKPVLPHPVRDY